MDLLSQLIRALSPGIARDAHQATTKMPQPNRYGGSLRATQPMRAPYPADFAARDYPGRTNYGVPEDDMIDTPDGYVTRDQYNQRMTQYVNQGRQMYGDRYDEMRSRYDANPREFNVDPAMFGYAPDMAPRPQPQRMGGRQLQPTGPVMDIADEGGAISPQIQLKSATHPIQGGNISVRGKANAIQGGGLLGQLSQPRRRR